MLMRSNRWPSSSKASFSPPGRVHASPLLVGRARVGHFAPAAPVDGAGVPTRKSTSAPWRLCTLVRQMASWTAPSETSTPCWTNARIAQDLAHVPPTPARQVQHLVRHATRAVPFQQQPLHLVVPRANFLRALAVPGVLCHLAVAFAMGLESAVALSSSSSSRRRTIADLAGFAFFCSKTTPGGRFPRRLLRLGVEVVRLSGGAACLGHPRHALCTNEQKKTIFLSLRLPFSMSMRRWISLFPEQREHFVVPLGERQVRQAWQSLSWLGWSWAGRALHPRWRGRTRPGYAPSSVPVPRLRLLLGTAARRKRLRIFRHGLLSRCRHRPSGPTHDCRRPTPSSFLGNEAAHSDLFFILTRKKSARPNAPLHEVPRVLVQRTIIPARWPYGFVLRVGGLRVRDALGRKRSASHAVVHGDILYDTEITNVRPFGIRQVVGPVKVHDQVHQFPRQRNHFPVQYILPRGRANANFILKGMRRNWTGSPVFEVARTQRLVQGECNGLPRLVCAPHQKTNKKYGCALPGRRRQRFHPPQANVCTIAARNALVPRSPVRRVWGGRLQERRCVRRGSTWPASTSGVGPDPWTRDAVAGKGLSGAASLVDFQERNKAGQTKVVTRIRVSLDAEHTFFPRR